MEKLMIGKIIMFKPTTKVIMENLRIIRLIMAEPTKIKNNYGKITMTKLIMVQLTLSEINMLNLTMNKVNKAKLTNE